MIKEMQFYSEGVQMAGTLYLPDNFQQGARLPVILLCHGFAGIQKILVPAFANGFCENNFAAFTFDYRGFGGSGGERGILVPDQQVIDVRNAITFVETLSEIDPGRIGLWGTSLGGAVAVKTAAKDKRIKVVVVQLTFASGERVITGRMSGEEKTKFIETLQKSWQRSVTKNKMLMLSPLQILSDEQSKEFFTQKVKEFPELDVRLPMSTIRHNYECNPGEELSKIHVPLFILSAGKDCVNPASESEELYKKANEPKSYYCIDEASHYEIYEGPHFKQAFDRELDWFIKYL